MIELTAELIREKMATDQRWLERAILAIYQRQTQDEQADQATLKRNGIGFNGGDASTGSYMATWLLKGNHLSRDFVAKARRIMPKYAEQLLRIANESKPKEA